MLINLPDSSVQFILQYKGGIGLTFNILSQIIYAARQTEAPGDKGEPRSGEGLFVC